MAGGDGDAAVELRLRRRGEELIDRVATIPPLDLQAELGALQAAAQSAEAVGALRHGAAMAFVADVVDALVVRGAWWFAPAVPDLDVTRLYDAAVGGGRPQLRRVVGVAARLDDAAVTSVELWSNRAVARVVSRWGAIEPSHVVGAAGVDERRLALRVSAGPAVTVDLAGGVAAREVPGTVVPATVERHLDVLGAAGGGPGAA